MFAYEEQTAIMTKKNRINIAVFTRWEFPS